MYSKKLDNAAEIIHRIPSGSTIMSGGFGLCGIPENSIQIISESTIDNLTVISNNLGNSGLGLVSWLKKNKIKKGICTYVGGNPDLEERILNNKIEIELVPQGTFIERIRSAGHGIPGFYTKTGVGTEVEQGKETKYFNEEKYILETALHADYALIKASIGDEFGNLYFEGASKNFSMAMAMAAKTTIVEVEKLVPIGEISPNVIHLPGLFVDHIYQGEQYKNTIEKLILKDSKD